VESKRRRGSHTFPHLMHVERCPNAVPGAVAVVESLLPEVHAGEGVDGTAGGALREDCQIKLNVALRAGESRRKEGGSV
jgi:hypothetical protein